MPWGFNANVRQVVHIVIPYGKSHCEHFTSNLKYLDGMRNKFVPLTLTTPGLLSGALLTTCRSLFFLSRDPQYVRLAMQYKVACLGHLNSAISCRSGVMQDATIAQALLLASDDVGHCLVVHS